MKPKTGFHDGVKWTTTGLSLFMQIVFAKECIPYQNGSIREFYPIVGRHANISLNPKKIYLCFRLWIRAIKFSSLPWLTDFFSDMYMFWLEIHKRLCSWNLFEGKVWDEITYPFPNFNALRWRHNERNNVWNRQPHDCLLNRLFRRRSKKTSKLRVTGLCAGNSPWPVNSPHKVPVTRKMFPFDDVMGCIPHNIMDVKLIHARIKVKPY